MKTYIALILFVVLCNIAIAQEKNTTKPKESPRRRGYIGFSLGPSFPIGDFAKQSFALDPGVTGSESTSTGLQLNLVNVGYLFTKHIGIAGSWFGAAYSRTSDFRTDLEPWSCGGIMIGPLISFPISEKVEWDLRPMLGRAVCSGQRQNTTPEPVESSASLIFNMGTVFRIHLAKKISLLVTADYFSTKLKFKDNGASPNGPPEQKMKALSLGLGFAYRLK